MGHDTLGRECPRCLKLFSPDDTVEFDGYTVAHLDCGRPRGLSPEEHVFLYVYCWDHTIAECPACAQKFRQAELGWDPPASAPIAAYTVIGT